MFAVSRIFTSSASGIGSSRKRRIVGVEVATSKKSIGGLFFTELDEFDRMVVTSGDAPDDRGVAMPAVLKLREQRQRLLVGDRDQ